MPCALRVFLLDEPLSNLDAKLRVQARAEISKLHQRLGTTFIYVTHDQGEALALSDRLAIMNAGRVEQVGDPADVYEFPATRFVADFVGNVNLIEANVVSADDDRVVLESEGAGGQFAAQLP